MGKKKIAVPVYAHGVLTALHADGTADVRVDNEDEDDSTDDDEHDSAARPETTLQRHVPFELITPLPQCGDEERKFWESETERKKLRLGGRVKVCWARAPRAGGSQWLSEDDEESRRFVVASTRRSASSLSRSFRPRVETEGARARDALAGDCAAARRAVSPAHRARGAGLGAEAAHRVPRGHAGGRAAATRAPLRGDDDDDDATPAASIQAAARAATSPTRRTTSAERIFHFDEFRADLPFLQFFSTSLLATRILPLNDDDDDDDDELNINRPHRTAAR